MAYVQIVKGNYRGRIWNLVEGGSVIGRVRGAVKIADPAVSGLHARLTVEPSSGQWILEDLGSTNGTFLNGNRLTEPIVLQEGDEIRIGNTNLKFGGTVDRAGTGVPFDEEGDLVSAGIVETFPFDKNTYPFGVPVTSEEGAVNLRLIFELVAEVNSILDLDLLVQRTLDWIFRIFPAERGYILMNDKNGTLSLKASVFNARNADKVPISRTIVQEVVDKQVGLIIANAMTDERFRFHDSAINLGMRSALCIPIKGRDDVEGIIYLDINSGRHRYTTDQLKLLTAIGYHIGLAVENVQLHELALQTERLTAVGETAAYLSHHIKNILQGLGSGVDVVELCLETDDLPRAKNSWPLVRSNLRKINKIILDMLAFSKEREPLLQNVNVNQLLKECLDLEKPQAEERGIELKSELTELPEIEADPVGLHQAFLNLVNNAVEAVQDGNGKVTVDSRFDRENQNVVVNVSDNGAGIAPERLGDIFTPFFSSKGHKGTGLGLTVAHMIIEEHQGSIAVKSTVNGGTTFTVTLPSSVIYSETIVVLD